MELNDIKKEKEQGSLYKKKPDQKKNETYTDLAASKKNLEDLQHQSMDNFEKMMNLLSKDEHHAEALLSGIGMLLIGIIIIFAGDQAANYFFGAVCCVIYTLAWELLFCVIFDVERDSVMGWFCLTMAFLSSFPLISQSMRYAYRFAVPLITGLSMIALAEITLSINKVTDNQPYHLKTIYEAVSAIVGFLIALKI